MATYWHNNIFKFSLAYWLKREVDGGEKELVGKIQFNLLCRKLPEGKLQIGPTSMAVSLRMRCRMLIQTLAFKHEMYEAEILDMLSYSMCSYRVDADSIEPDNQRMLREFQEHGTGLDLL